MFIQQGLHEALKRKAASHLPQHNIPEAFEAISRHISHYCAWAPYKSYRCAPSRLKQRSPMSVANEAGPSQFCLSNIHVSYIFSGSWETVAL